MSDSSLLMAFYGDDFTGSTDAMESLASSGLRTVLFTRPPEREQLAQYDGLRAFGVAGRTRAMTPDQMRPELTRAFAALRATGVPIIHYKVCSTFDSSPGVGSIGCAIDIGAEVIGARCVPIVAGAPALGRHCVFGNLFARGAGEASPVRLDRHPNMRNHPVTPMNEADLRLHLNWQTEKSIALFDITQLDLEASVRRSHYETLLAGHDGAVLIDFLHGHQSSAIGDLLLTHAALQSPLFVVGSSGVEAALAAHWGAQAAETPERSPAETPLLVAVGSCSPVTARQIHHAQTSGFAVLRVHAEESEDLETVRDATKHLAHGGSVVIDTGGSDRQRHPHPQRLAESLARATRAIIERSGVRRLLVAGGDTSGQIAEALEISSLEMLAPLARGAPLCRAASALPAVNEMEVVFKGGQIGGDGFFDEVRRGSTNGVAP